MKMMMSGLESVETSSSVVSVEKSTSSSSQSTSMVSTSTEYTEGGQQRVVSKVEESASASSASRSVGLEIVDGEVKSSVEETSQETAQAVRSVEKDNDTVKESQMVMQEAAGVLVADGEVIKSHQEHQINENSSETKIESFGECEAQKDTTVTEESVKQNLEKKTESSHSSSSSSSSDEKKSLIEVDPEDILPPPPLEDFPPPPADLSQMMTSVEDLPPPVFDLPSPTEEDLPPPNKLQHDDDVNEGMTNGNKDEETPDGGEDAGKEAKSSYVTLVSPTGFKTFSEAEAAEQ